MSPFMEEVPSQCGPRFNRSPAESLWSPYQVPRSPGLGSLHVCPVFGLGLHFEKRYATRLGRGRPSGEATQTGDRGCEGAVRLSGL